MSFCLFFEGVGRGVAGRITNVGRRRPVSGFSGREAWLPA